MLNSALDSAVKRIAGNLAVAGVLSQFDNDAVEDYLSNTVGNEVGALIGQEIGQGVNGLLKDLTAKPDQEMAVAAASMTGNTGPAMVAGTASDGQKLRVPTVEEQANSSAFEANDEGIVIDGQPKSAPEISASAKPVLATGASEVGPVLDVSTLADIEASLGLENGDLEFLTQILNELAAGELETGGGFATLQGDLDGGALAAFVSEAGAVQNLEQQGVFKFFDEGLKDSIATLGAPGGGSILGIIAQSMGLQFTQDITFANDDLVRRDAVLEADLADFPGRPVRVDLPTPDQFGLKTEEQVEAFRRAIIQGSGKVQ